ncbi:pol protein [Cucumis melo var. makuwa]|uniref:Pol protein n=1 Tax=Cucumis melo var. makuwa TaxID=1194695 RepID=A0A5A7SQD9_CUCMM|nr:pol protein [Cucumis melo var. makuwa]
MLMNGISILSLMWETWCLKVVPMKNFLRFEKKGKLSPHFIESFEILERIDPIAYRLALSLTFSVVHDVFHVSMLRKYVVDSTHVVDFEPLHINENLSYEEQLVEILAREVKMLRNRGIALVKVLWRNHGAEKATWERQDDMRAQYPELKNPSLPSPLPSSPPQPPFVTTPPSVETITITIVVFRRSRHVQPIILAARILPVVRLRRPSIAVSISVASHRSSACRHGSMLVVVNKRALSIRRAVFERNSSSTHTPTRAVNPRKP